MSQAKKLRLLIIAACIPLAFGISSICFVWALCRFAWWLTGCAWDGGAVVFLMMGPAVVSVIAGFYVACLVVEFSSEDGR